MAKTSTDLSRIEDFMVRLDSKMDALDTKMEHLETNINTLYKKIDHLEKNMEVQFTEVKGDIKRLDQRIEDTRISLEKHIEDTNTRIDDSNARLNTFTIGYFGILGILVTGILTVLGKLVFFPSLPIS